MFTIKHTMPDRSEFLVDAGSVSARRYDVKDGKSVMIVGRETQSDDSPVVGIWGGVEAPYSGAREGFGLARMFVMNRHGATVATYSYLVELATLVEPNPVEGEAELIATMEEEAVAIAA